MIIESQQAIGKCDNCEKNNATHGAVAQGATGRYCEVMWICKACAIKWAGGEENILTYEDALKKCEKDGYPDF